MAFLENDQQLAIALLAYSSEYALQVREILKPEEFSRVHGLIFQAAARYHKRMRGRVVGEAHLFDVVQDLIQSHPKDAEALVQITKDVASVHAVGFSPEFAMSRVERYQKWILYRNFSMKIYEAVEGGTDADLARAEEATAALKTSLQASTVRELLDMSDAQQVRRAFSVATQQPLQLSLDPLNTALAIPHRGQLFAIAGAQGQGKTQFLYEAALMISRINDVHGLFFSMEMSNSEMAARGIMNMTGRTLTGEGRYTDFVRDGARKVVGFESTKIKTGLLEDYEDAELDGFFADGAVHVDDKPRVSPEYVRMRIQQLKDRGIYPAYVVLDYWQIMHNESVDRKYDNQEENLLELYEIAKEENVAVILGSQFNRDNSDGTDPTRKNIKGSVSLFDHCHVVLFLAQTKIEKMLGVIRLIIDKNRNYDGGLPEILVTTGFSNAVFGTDAVFLEEAKQALAEELDDLEDDEDDDA